MSGENWLGRGMGSQEQPSGLPQEWNWTLMVLHWSSKEPLRGQAAQYWGSGPGGSGKRNQFFKQSGARQTGKTKTKPLIEMATPTNKKATGPGELCMFQKLLGCELVLGAGRAEGWVLQTEMVSILPFQDVVNPPDRSSLLEVKDFSSDWITHLEGWGQDQWAISPGGQQQRNLTFAGPGTVRWLWAI